MKKFLLQTLNKEDCIVFILVLAFISISIIFSLLISTISEIEKNSYVEPVFIPKVINKTKEKFGIASWYNYSLGDIDPEMGGHKIQWSKIHNTAASRTLIRYSKAKVTNIENGKSIIVFINDYGPEEKTGREIDLSSHAFLELAPLSIGLINVKIEQL